MPVKMIVSDLDRTLLRSDKTISEYTTKVLVRCRERGIKFVFATARPKNRIDILPFMDLADAVVVNNGSAVYVEGELVHRFGIAAETAKPLMKQLLTAYPDLHISIEYGDIAYANMDISELWETEMHQGFDDLPETEADKIVIRAGADMFDDVQKSISDTLYAQLCENRLILIMHKTAAKWKAIQHLAAHFRISIADVAAFGDDYNDIEMLKNCGFGVAVANAFDEAKAAADYVCESNDNDGVAQWMDENAL